MKTKKIRYNLPLSSSEPLEMREQMMPVMDAVGAAEAMVRTQIYLSRGEHEFLQVEASRRSVSMASVIRTFIEEKMAPPNEAWENNPLLDAPADPEFTGPEDGVINHDHYVYGSPKKWVKQGKAWTEAPPLPDDYFTKQDSGCGNERIARGKI
ncbi:MAG: hypothetical protein WCO56_01425 [Verrucomicrobiota bacterium]